MRLMGISLIIASLLLISFSFAGADSEVSDEPVLLSMGNSDPVSNPGGSSISIWGDDIHVVWYDVKGTNGDQSKVVYYANSLDGGHTWKESKALTLAAGMACDPVIDSYGDNVYVTWVDEKDGNKEIYFKASNDRGNEWLPYVRITNDDNRSMNPTMVVLNNNIYIAWEEETEDNFTFTRSIYHTWSIDGGNTWEDPVLLTKTFEAHSPYLTYSGGILHLLYVNETSDSNHEIFHLMSDDNGKTWSTPFRLNYKENGDRRQPVAAVSNNNLHVFWWEKKPVSSDINPLVTTGIYEIYHKQSPDNGEGWRSAHSLSTTTGLSRDVCVSSTDAVTAVAWSEDGQNDQVYLKASKDDGENWFKERKITTSSKDSINPGIEVDGNGYVHLVWTEDSEGIYYQKMTADIGDGKEEDSYTSFLILIAAVIGILAILGTTFYVNWRDRKKFS